MINNYINNLQSENLLWGLFSYDTLLIVVVTLFVSFSLLLIKELFEKCTKTINLRNISKYFIHSINDLIYPISLEINSLNTLSQNIINTDNSDFIFRQNHKLSTDNIKNISQFDIYKYFLLRKPNQLKNKYFSDIQNSIEFVRLYKNRIFKTFNDFLDKFQNYQSQWDFHFEKFGCTIYDIYSPFVSNRNDLKDELLISIDKILTEYTSTPIKNNHSLHFTHTKFIIPIKKICRESRNNKYSIQLLPTIDFLEKTYNNIVYIQKFYSETVKNEEENLIQHYKLLKEAIDYFKKVYKFKT